MNSSTLLETIKTLEVQDKTEARHELPSSASLTELATALFNILGKPVSVEAVTEYIRGDMRAMYTAIHALAMPNISTAPATVSGVMNALIELEPRIERLPLDINHSVNRPLVVKSVTGEPTDSIKYMGGAVETLYTAVENSLAITALSTLGRIRLDDASLDNLSEVDLAAVIAADIDPVRIMNYVAQYIDHPAWDLDLSHGEEIGPSGPLQDVFTAMMTVDCPKTIPLLNEIYSAMVKNIRTWTSPSLALHTCVPTAAIITLRSLRALIAAVIDGRISDEDIPWITDAFIEDHRAIVSGKRVPELIKMLEVVKPITKH